MNEPMAGDWLKGGLRYAKLRRIIPEYLAPETVEAFFVAVGRRRTVSRLVNPLTLLQCEYVVAVTAQRVVVLKLRLPGVFRAAIEGPVYDAGRDEVGANFEDGRVVLDGVDYWPISYHGEDAEALVSLIADAQRL